MGFFVIGIIIGSFLNVCIYRIPKKQSVITTPSHCPACDKRIAWYDLVPLLSYLILAGKCRNCKTNISLRYPLIELANALLYVLIATVLIGFKPEPILWRLAAFCFLTSVLLVITVIDFETYEIPDKILLVAFFVGIVYNIVRWDVNFSINSLIGFFAISVPLLLIAMLTKGSMGGGDIKLMAVAGLFIGWKLMLAAFFIAIVLGGLISVGLLWTSIKKRKDPIPFGPFLALGIYLSILFGDDLIRWYLITSHIAV
ncbi:MAG: prepilin peptidase [Hyphomonadaceae bacterium]|nr:prepilin peptidase [Clostridia bacterium]